MILCTQAVQYVSYEGVLIVQLLLQRNRCPNQGVTDSLFPQVTNSWGDWPSNTCWISGLHPLVHLSFQFSVRCVNDPKIGPMSKLNGGWSRYCSLFSLQSLWTVEQNTSDVIRWKFICSVSYKYSPNFISIEMEQVLHQWDKFLNCSSNCVEEENVCPLLLVLLDMYTECNISLAIIYWIPFIHILYIYIHIHTHTKRNTYWLTLICVCVCVHVCTRATIHTSSPLQSYNDWNK